MSKSIFIFVILAVVLIFFVAPSLSARSAGNNDDYEDYDNEQEFLESGPKFNYAMITLPSGELIEGRLDYCIYGESRVILKLNGVWYSVAHLDVVLMEKK